MKVQELIEALGAFDGNLEVGVSYWDAAWKLKNVSLNEDETPMVHMTFEAANFSNEVEDNHSTDPVYGSLDMISKTDSNGNNIKCYPLTKNGEVIGWVRKMDMTQNLSQEAAQARNTKLRYWKTTDNSDLIAAAKTLITSDFWTTSGLTNDDEADDNKPCPLFYTEI